MSDLVEHVDAFHDEIMRSLFVLRNAQAKLHKKINGHPYGTPNERASWEHIAYKAAEEIDYAITKYATTYLGLS